MQLTLLKLLALLNKNAKKIKLYKIFIVNKKLNTIYAISNK